MKFRHQKYTCISTPWGSTVHKWETVGPKGAVHFTANYYKNDTGDEPSCGLEFHHFEAGEHFIGQAPHHLDCPLTGGRCWHDGTSLYASETLWPRIKYSLKDGEHDVVFGILQYEYTSRFEQTNENK